MAQQTTVTLIDDIDATKTADETVTFALDGKNYEIDLASDNAARLREGLKAFVQAARRPSAARRTTYRPAPARTNDRERNQAMRNWANNNGFELSDRGRIPEKVVNAWANAGAPMDVAPAEKPKFEEPEPVEGAPWNHLDTQQRAQVKAWSAMQDIDPLKWTRNAKARDAMSTYALNNDIKGAKAYVDAL